MYRSVLAACAVFMAFAAAQAATPAAPNQAGVIVLAEGEARIASGAAAARPAKAGDVVNEGDQLITGKNGEIHARLQDTAFLVVRPNSRIQVSEYLAEGGDKDRSVLQLLAGGVRSITGWIGKFNSRAYVLKTPTATIGVRGTDHETRYLPEGSTEGEAGTYDRVYAGETFIETPGGQATVSPNQAGFHPLRSREKARLLASIPKFYQPGPHEAEISKKHAEIQAQIGQRREERRKAIAEKRAALEQSRAKMKEIAKQEKGRLPKASPAERRELLARRDVLQKDTQAAKEQQEGINARRKAIEQDFKAGTISMQEARKRRKALQDEEQVLAKTQESLQQRRKALQDEFDARLEERTSASPALHDQFLETKDKRQALEEEREAAAKEMKGLRREEAKRYREELKADRKGAAPADPPPKQ